MLHFVCAFFAEAVPIIDSFNLDKLNGDLAFDVYTNYEKSITLTISGLGKLAAASAVSYTHALLQCNTHEAWLNIGIAGHGHAKLGELYFASTVIDKATQQRWFPQFSFDVSHAKAVCETVDQPSNDYKNTLLEMEASGFYSSAIRFSSYELIHVIKIISDNHEQSFKQLDKNTVTDLMQQQIPIIRGYTNRILELVKEVTLTKQKPKHYETLVKNWHFTQTQEIQLEKQLRRWHVLNPEQEPLPVFIHSKDARSLLSEITNMLDNMDISL